MEERPAAATVLVGNLDAHHPQAEQAVDDGARHLPLVVHLTDEWADVALREFIHAVAKQQLVFGERRQSRLHRQHFTLQRVPGVTLPVLLTAISLKRIDPRRDYVVAGQPGWAKSAVTGATRPGHSLCRSHA